VGRARTARWRPPAPGSGVSQDRHKSFINVPSGNDLVDTGVFEAIRSVKKNPSSAWPAAPIEVARTLYRNRRARNRHFDDSLFAEPRWDILLDLFIAEEEGRSISVSSACIGAAVPHATALRHLGMMQRNGLIERRAHPRDARCQQVRITASAATSMHELFADLA
jgi:DNA-binding MarR family transcriptional regulator